MEWTTHLLGATTDPYNCATAAMDALDSLNENKGEIQERLNFSRDCRGEKFLSFFPFSFFFSFGATRRLVESGN